MIPACLLALISCSNAQLISYPVAVPRNWPHFSPSITILRYHVDFFKRTSPPLPESAQTSRLVVTQSRPSENRLVLHFAGRLDINTLQTAWTDTTHTVSQSSTPKITLDLTNLTYCDASGLGLFIELRRLALTRKAILDFDGMTPDLCKLVGMADLTDPTAGGLTCPKPINLVTYLGMAATTIFHDIGKIVVFIGELAAGVAWAARHPKKVRWDDVIDIANKAGTQGLPVVLLLGLLVGVILAFQASTALKSYGGDSLVPVLVGLSLIRELGPLITAILLSGRSGSAFAAELGTMKVTEELSALETLGIRPVRFLVVPRLLAALFVTPLLTGFNILAGLVGGYLVMASKGYTSAFYVDSVIRATNTTEFLASIFKSFVFGFIVAGVGCLRGVQTGSGPGAVGDSTTRAVVAGIVLTILADAVLGFVYYQLGI
jgi:phospholipid/cholesterol/gamma-HCH transport system permease protein